MPTKVLLVNTATETVKEAQELTPPDFELIVAAAHDEDLRPVVAVYHGMLADLLTPYEGDRGRAQTVAAGVQGLLLVQMVSPFPPDPTGLGAAVADLIRRYRVTEPATDARDRSAERHN